MHQPTNWKPAFLFFCFCPGDITEIEIMTRKNTKAIITCLQKKKGKGRLSVLLHVWSKYKVNFQIQKRKIERGIAEMPFSPFFVENI